MKKAEIIDFGRGYPCMDILPVDLYHHAVKPMFKGPPIPLLFSRKR
jgi:hypothetical protein